MPVNPVAGKAGGLVTEMFICEVAHVVLHIDQLYIFRVHTLCDECLRLAQYSPGFVQVMVEKDPR